MTNFTRRTFLKTGSVALAATAIPYSLAGAKTLDQTIEEMLTAQDIRALTTAALEAAKGAGAVYADVQFRVTRQERWAYFLGLEYPTPFPSVVMGLGVRALVNGYWGFAGMDGFATVEDAGRLGRDSAGQARTAAKGKPRTAELAPTSVANGSWSMPVQIDPFTVSYEEKADFFAGMRDFVQRQRYGVGTGYDLLNFVREERTFASSEGSFTTQTVYQTNSSLSVGVPRDWKTELLGGRNADFLSVAGSGWEFIRKAPFQDSAAQLINDALKSRRPKPIDVGRYDIVFDPHALAGIISTTIGAATELDRAFGYEANEAGTSYLNAPLEMLGTFKVGSPLLNITANRSMPGGAATVKWDDEGVEPVETTLVKDGILNDFQTTRESASWIADYYKKRGAPVRSNGCAGMYSPTSPVTQVNPNFVLAPAASAVSFEDMVKDTKKGLAIFGGLTTADQQALNGAGTGSMVYEIIDGKLGEVIDGAQYLYRAPDFWKNLVAVGDRSTVQMHGFTRYRNGGSASHTVSAVPAKVTGVAVTDIKRKA